MTVKTFNGLALASIKTVDSLAIASAKTFNGAMFGFAPVDLPNCKLWLDASDPDTIVSSGGLVSQWLDKSGNNNHATASGTARPTTGTRTLNGLNVLDYNGTSNYMALANGISGGIYTIYFVTLVDSLSATLPRSIIGSTNTGGPVMRFANTATTGKMQVVRRGQAVLLTANTTNVIATPYSFIITTYNSGNAVNRNGAGDGSNATSASYTQPIQAIGSESSTSYSNGQDGIIAETAIYTGILTSPQITQLNNYSTAKWAVP